MYKVMVKGVEKEIDAKCVSFQDGGILFFYDDSRQKLKAVVPNGSWDSFETTSEEKAIILAKPEVKKEEELLPGAEQAAAIVEEDMKSKEEAK